MKVPNKSLTELLETFEGIIENGSLITYVGFSIPEARRVRDALRDAVEDENLPFLSGLKP